MDKLLNYAWPGNVRELENMTDSKNDLENKQKASKSEAENDKPTPPGPKDKSSFFDKVKDVADKSRESLKLGLEKVAHFTSSSAKLTKLQLEIHNLNNDRDKLNLEAGKKLWRIRNENRLNTVKSVFAGDFKKMADLCKKFAMNCRKAHLPLQQKLPNWSRMVARLPQQGLPMPQNWRNSIGSTETSRNQ